MNWFAGSWIFEICRTIGWIIIHSIWQGTLLAFLFVIILVVFKKFNIRIKYFLSVLILFLFLISSLVTFFQVSLNGNDNIKNTKLDIETKSENQINTITHSEEFDKYNIEIQTEQSQKFHNFFIGLIGFLDKIAIIIAIIWLSCVFVLFFKILIPALTPNKLINRNLQSHSKKWQQKIDALCKIFKIKRKVKVFFSIQTKSPFVFGFYKPIILFPVKLVTGLNEKEIEAIFVHELVHVFRNDYLVNLFQTILETLFFYHPAVRWISSEIRKQREIICDQITLNYLKDPKFYANTLLKLEEQRLAGTSLALAVNKNKNELLTRIKWIFNKQNSNELGINKGLISGLTVLSALFFVFALTGFNNSTKIKPAIGEKYVQINLNKYFKPYSGSFVLYDLNNNTTIKYNDSINTKRYSPFSTFKIVSSLLALETGLAQNEQYTIAYDSIKNPAEPGMYNSEPFKYWLQDQTIASALKYSVNWYFHELNNRIGIEIIDKYLSEIKYGNHDISSGIDNFWIGGSLEISSMEQLSFLKMLYNNKLEGFHDKSQNIVKKIMLNEITDKYKLYGKTGMGNCLDDKVIGWYVGFIETGKNTYLFAMNIIVDDYSDLSNNKRLKLTKSILRELKILE